MFQRSGRPFFINPNVLGCGDAKFGTGPNFRAGRSSTASARNSRAAAQKTAPENARAQKSHGCCRKCDLSAKG